MRSTLRSAVISRSSTAGAAARPVARHLVVLAEEPEDVDDVLAGGRRRDDLVERAHGKQVLAQLADQALVGVACKWSDFLRMHQLLAFLALSMSLLSSSSARSRRPAGRLATGPRAGASAARRSAKHDR